MEKQDTTAKIPMIPTVTIKFVEKNRKAKRRGSNNEKKHVLAMIKKLMSQRIEYRSAEWFDSRGIPRDSVLIEKKGINLGATEILSPSFYKEIRCEGNEPLPWDICLENVIKRIDCPSHENNIVKFED